MQMRRKPLLSAIVIAVLSSVAFVVGCGVIEEEHTYAPATLSLPVESPTPSDEDATVISSSGESSPLESPTQPTGEVGSIPGGALPSPSTESPTPSSQETAVNWEVYRDDTYGYEIRYPPAYIILEEVQQQKPQLLQQVRFQDRELAGSDTASLELPQFSIEVFDNSSQLPIEQWLEDHQLVGGGKRFEMKPYSLAGVRGVRVSTPLMLAPRQFIYVSKGPYVFKLTPLGKYSEQMLATFKFTR